MPCSVYSFNSNGNIFTGISHVVVSYGVRNYTGNIIGNLNFFFFGYGNNLCVGFICVGKSGGYTVPKYLCSVGNAVISVCYFIRSGFFYFGPRYRNRVGSCFCLVKSNGRSSESVVNSIITGNGRTGIPIYRGTYSDVLNITAFNRGCFPISVIVCKFIGITLYCPGNRIWIGLNSFSCCVIIW